MPQDLLSMLSPLALLLVLVGMCFRPFDVLVKLAVLTAVPAVFYGYYEFHAHGDTPGFVLIAYAVLMGYTAFSIVQLYLLRLFGFKAAAHSSFVLEGTITGSRTYRSGNSETVLSRDRGGESQAQTTYSGTCQDEVQFQNDRNSKVITLRGQGLASTVTPGDRAFIAGNERLGVVSILYNKTTQKVRFPHLLSVVEATGLGLLKAIPFLGQTAQALVLIFSYVIPLSTMTVMGETRGPFDRRHLMVGLVLTAWPLSQLWEHFSWRLAFWVYLGFAMFYIAQMLLIRDEHKRFNDMLWMKIQYALVKDKLV